MAQATIISKCHCKYVYFIIVDSGTMNSSYLQKQERSSSYQLFSSQEVHHIIIIIAFHLNDRIVWIIIIVHMHWTKLESASIQFEREDKLIWALCQINNNSYKSHFNNLIMVFPALPPKNKKRNKTIYTRKLPTSKRRTRNIFGFYF